VQDKLRSLRINVNTAGRRGTPLDMAARRLNSVVRAAVHYYNTDDELERLIAAIRQLSRQA
jgi:cysteine desulfurase / selenocysteine lyase